MNPLQCALTERSRTFAQHGETVSFVAESEVGLDTLLRRPAGLAPALPSQLAQLPAGGTEVAKRGRQRGGQQRLREAVLDYWGGTCAVTGVADGSAVPFRRIEELRFAVARRLSGR